MLYFIYSFGNLAAYLIERWEVFFISFHRILKYVDGKSETVQVVKPTLKSFNFWFVILKGGYKFGDEVSV